MSTGAGTWCRKKSDDIRDCIKNHTMAQKVIAHAKPTRRFTVKALAADLAL